MLYNRLRIQTVDKLLFPAYPEGQIPFIRKWQAYPFQITPVQKAHFDAPLYQYMEMWDHWPQEEYIIHFKEPCIIEPKHGWAIVQPNRLVYPSLGMSHALHQPKPDFIKMLAHQPLKEFECVVSLRDTGEENYFHFYNDVLAKLLLLEEHLKLDRKIPLIVSKKLWDKPFFHYFLNLPPLKDRNWIVQDNFYIKAKTAYFCKPLTHTKRYYDQILNWIPWVPEGNSLNRRIFLTRNPKRLRFIKNLTEIENLCNKYDFEIVDADELSLSEQVQLFAEARYVIGIHGAGLTNIIYRRGITLAVLEIFPPPTLGYLPFQYILMSALYGYRYDAVIGEEDNIKYSGGFILNSGKLESKIQKMIN